ncbi:MAG: hypothetical protein VW456_10765, partial [Alphaproteobacteria bacterium]
NPDGNSDILAAMQAVAAMMAGQRGTVRSSEPGADVASQDDILLVDEDDFTGLDGKPDEDMILINPMMIGPMPLQQQAGTALPAAETSAAMAQMALEDEAVIPHPNNGRAVLNNPILSSHPSGALSQMAALSWSSPQTMKSADKPQSHSDPINDMPTGELDIDASQLRSGGRPDGRPVIKPATYQQIISQAGIAN